MKRNICLMLAASGLGVVCLAHGDSDRWTVHEEETIEKTMTLAGEPMRLVVDNLNGRIHVTGGNGPQVHVVAHKTIHAETQADLQQAKRDVKLEMAEQPGTVSVEYKAPWRCNGQCDGCCSDHKHFYEVSYDIEVQAPRGARPVVSSVNGQVMVDGMDGDYTVRSVNGPVKMSGVGGSGDVSTVNGPVTVRFAKNPARACSVKTVNGQLDVYFQPGLSADLLFKTFHGDIYSNFDVAPLTIAAAEEKERHDGMYVYRSDRRSGGRVGRGGPQISFETLNGGIRLHEGQD